MKYILLIYIQLISLTVSAQLITQKNGRYGITNTTTGDVMVEQKYDTIYQLCLRPADISGRKGELCLPIFVCNNKDQLQIFNSITASFFNGTFDEVKMYNESQQNIFGSKEPTYTPFWVNCFMIRKGNYWSYISHRKEYGFHDKIEDTDTFELAEPQYEQLKFVQETNGYSSQKYARKKRIIAAKKDSLWGALDFETGEVVVPFIYKLPIHAFNNSYDNRGLEFLSTKGGFIKYYIARIKHDAIPQLIINPEHPEVSFELNYSPQVSIYNEFSDQFLYTQPFGESGGSFKLYNFTTGKLLLSYERDLRYKYFLTERRVENVLLIYESTNYEKLFRQFGFNLTTGEVIFYAEGKDAKLRVVKSNDEVILMKEKKPVGKIVGEGADMKVEWTTKKHYTK